jgi:hypothetical protein
MRRIEDPKVKTNHIPELDEWEGDYGFNFSLGLPQDRPGAAIGSTVSITTFLSLYFLHHFNSVSFFNCLYTVFADDAYIIYQREPSADVSILC